MTTKLTIGEYQDMVEWIDSCSVESIRNELSLIKFPLFITLIRRLHSDGSYSNIGSGSGRSSSSSSSSRSSTSSSKPFLDKFKGIFAPSFKPVINELYEYAIQDTTMLTASKSVFTRIFNGRIRIVLSEEAIQILERYMEVAKVQFLKKAITFKPEDGDKNAVFIQGAAITSSQSPNGSVDNSRNLGYYVSLALEAEQNNLLELYSLRDDILRPPYVLTPPDPDSIKDFMKEFDPCTIIQKDIQEKRSKAGKHQRSGEDGRASAGDGGAAGAGGFEDKGGKNAAGDEGNGQSIMEEIKKLIEEYNDGTDTYNIGQSLVPESLTKANKEYSERVVFSRKTAIKHSLDQKLIYCEVMDKIHSNPQKKLIKNIPGIIRRAVIPDGPDSTPTVCMYTIHDPESAVTAVTFSKDCSLLAVGMENSLIFIASLDPKAYQGQLFINVPEMFYNPNNNSSNLNQNNNNGGSGGESGSSGSSIIPKFTCLAGHEGPVYGLSFSPDNRFLVSCSADSTCKLWWLNLSNLEGTNISTHTSPPLGPPIWDIKFSPGGFLFASVGQDSNVRVWKTTSTEPFRMFTSHVGETTAVAFHPTCRFVASGAADYCVRMWTLDDIPEEREDEKRRDRGRDRGRDEMKERMLEERIKGPNDSMCVRVFTGHSGIITALCFSPDGKHLASADANGRIIVWNVADGSFTDLGDAHKGAVNSLEFDVDGCILAAGSNDSSISIWDVSNYDDIRLQRMFLAKEGMITNVMFTRRNLLVVVGICKGEDAPSLQPPPAKKGSVSSIIAP